MSDFVDLRARRLLEAGMAAISRRDFQDARQEFQASAELSPTAEAYTYWGWMEHHLGDTTRAIELCHKAIEVDPSFGNPYNDIGSYLVSQGDPDAAIPWLERAVEASRYEPRHFPHLNLGRIYLARKHYDRALEHYLAAHRYSPEDEAIGEAITAIRRLRSKVN